MIVYLANKTQFRADILSNRIEEIVHESFQGAPGKSVGASELASWKNSLRHMDTVLEVSEISHDPEHPHSNSSSAFFGALLAFDPARQRSPFRGTSRSLLSMSFHSIAVKKSFIATRGARLEAAGLANDFPNPVFTA